MLLGLMATFMIERNVEFQLEVCKNEDVNFSPSKVMDPYSPTSILRSQIKDLWTKGSPGGWENQLQLTQRSNHYHQQSSLLGPWRAYIVYMNNATTPSHHPNANIKPNENGKTAPKAVGIKVYKEKLQWHDALRKESKF